MKKYPLAVTLLLSSLTAQASDGTGLRTKPFRPSSTHELTDAQLAAHEELKERDTEEAQTMGLSVSPKSQPQGQDTPRTPRKARNARNARNAVNRQTLRGDEAPIINGMSLLQEDKENSSSTTSSPASSRTVTPPNSGDTSALPITTGPVIQVTEDVTAALTVLALAARPKTPPAPTNTPEAKDLDPKDAI